MPWRRKWQPTPVFWLGESHAQRKLAGYSPWSRGQTRLRTHTVSMVCGIYGICTVYPWTITKLKKKIIEVYFTMLHQRYSKASQLYRYRYRYIQLFFFYISFQFRSPQSIDQHSLCLKASPHQLSILHIAVYIWQSQSPNSSHSPSAPWVSIHLLSMSVSPLK